MTNNIAVYCDIDTKNLDTEPALFMVSMHVCMKTSKKMSIKAEKKQKNAIFLWKYV